RTTVRSLASLTRREGRLEAEHGCSVLARRQFHRSQQSRCDQQFASDYHATRQSIPAAAKLRYRDDNSRREVVDPVRTPPSRESTTRAAAAIGAAPRCRS